ncbi:cytochrome-c oxidase, cbb3-type subunit III [Vibrio sp.]|nr:cytochrome-c oxidase, cbb3-type subunit III [Vibrio sp.]
MTTFWSLWIIIITVGTLVGCAIILRWCLGNNTGIKEGDDMGHEYDGIREINNPPPKWWSYLFVSTFVFAAVYFALYPGLGSFKGFLNWTSSNQLVQTADDSKQHLESYDPSQSIDQYALELEMSDKTFGEALTKLARNDGKLIAIPEIAENDDALKVGQRLFLQNCAQCHGSDARGQKGFPNLTDKAWLYGGEPEAIVTTIMHGRVGEMPAWKDALGADGVQEVVTYALSLSGRKVNDRDAQAGKNRFVVCAACHGTDGKGNPAVGAPDLTDQDWLFGGSRAAVTETVMNGRSGVMPAWKDILGEDKVQLVGAYVWSLSNKEDK